MDVSDGPLGVVHVWVTWMMLLTLLMSSSDGEVVVTETCSASPSPVLQENANVFVGGLMAFSQPGGDNYGCGGPEPGGMQEYEAVRWALSRLNQDQGSLNGQVISDSYIPGVKLGMIVRDTCGRPELSVDALTDFLPEISGSAMRCTSNTTKAFLGVMGDGRSLSSSVSEVLSQYKIPGVFYTAASPGVTHTKTLSSVIRTVPTEQVLTQVLLATLSELGWTNVAIVHTDNDQGRTSYRSVTQAAKNAGVCVSESIRIPQGATSSGYEDAVRRLVAGPTTAVLYVGDKDTAAGMLAAASSVANSGRLQWLLPDTVGIDRSVIDSRNYARGILTVAPASRPISEFEDHWVRLGSAVSPNNNPWYRNWYMTVNRCRLAGVNYVPYNTYNQCPSPSESQRRASFQQSPYVEPALVTVFTYAKAIKNARQSLCPGQRRGLCPAFLRMTSEDFYKNYLLKVDFTFGREERMPSLASARIDPYRSAKRIRFNAAGEILDPSYAVYNYNDRTGAFQFNQVGTFMGGRLSVNKNQLRMYDEARRRALPNIPESKCPAGGCLSCVSGGTTASTPVYIPGDIVIGGLFSVHNPGTTSFTCGSVNTEDGAELLQAFLYAIENARSLNYWRGNVKLGGIAFDDCSSPQLASNTLSNFFNGDDFGLNADANKVYGYTGGNDDAITLAVASILSPIPLPLVGYKPAPAPLSDKNMFPNFAGLLPDKSGRIKAMTQLLKRLGVSHIRIIHDNSEQSGDMLEAFQQLAMSENLCVGGIGLSDPNNFQEALQNVYSKPDAKVLLLEGDFSHFEQFLSALNRSSNAAEYLVILSSSVNAETSFVNKKYVFRSLTTKVRGPTLDSWRQYLRSLTPDQSSANPWLKEWYQAALNCYVDASNTHGYPAMCQNIANTPIAYAPGYRENPYSTYVVMAVGALLRSIDKSLKQYCGESYSTVCSGFLNAADRSQTILKFLREDPNLNGAVVNGYDIMYMRPSTRAFTVVGDVKQDPSGDTTRLNLNSGVIETIGQISSSCGSFCQDCLYMYEAQDYMYLPGEVLIAGLFGVHHQADEPYHCGTFRTEDGFQYTEAFRYAISKVNDRTAPVNLHGIKLGGIALDTCSDDLRASNLASSVYSGAIILRDDQGNPVDVNKIKGWLMYTSDISTQVGSLLGRLGVPAVSPSASSVTLNDKVNYPTFYRLVPSDDIQGYAMASLVDYLQWHYVQTVNEPNTYGRTGLESLVNILQENSNCAIASYEWITDGTADEIIAQLLASPSSVVVLFGGKNMTRQLLEAKIRAGRVADNLVFVTSEWIPDTPTAANALAFGVDMPTVQSFNSYLNSLNPLEDTTNPWLTDMYETVYRCNLAGGTRYMTPCADVASRPLSRSPGFLQDIRVVTTINAVYTLVQALHLALTDRCGANYQHLCKEFISAPDSMQLIVDKLPQVRFRDPSGQQVNFVNRQHDRGYAVYKYGSGGDSLRVGEYKSGVLRITDPSLQDSYKSVTSSCPGSCLQCQYQQKQNQHFTLVPGDVYMAGLFDVHSAGKAPLSCGAINTEQGWQLVEAFNFALGRVNNKTGMFHNLLPGVRVGGVGLDTCSSPNRAANLVANIQSGLIPITMGTDRINSELIELYIGAYDSDTSAAVANFLNVLGIPQLSYGATSTAFKDTDKYPNFLRTVPADDKLARAVVALLKNYKIEYVQVVNSPGTYGDDAAAEFSALAAENGICVAQVVQLAVNNGRLADGQAEQAVQHLLNKPQATVVVTFIGTDDVNTFLRAVNRVPQASRFHFLGSETWSNRLDVVQNVGNVAADALTLGVETADLSTFDQYLRTKTRGTYQGNPWFDEYYEAVFDCSLTPGTDKNPRPCPNDRDVVLAPGYTQDQYILYTVNAVYSAALGLHYALQKVCGDNYFGVCDDFRNSPQRHQLILEGIRGATFRDATNQRFDFTSDGESNRGYHIYTARKTPGTDNYFYENVGSYNDTDLLKIRPQQQFALSWSSDCSVPGACDECSLLGYQPTRGVSRIKPNLNLVGFFDVHHADPKEPLKCGQLNIDYGFQNMLALFYAIDRFNRNNRYGVELGGVAIDTCSSSVRVYRDLFSLLMGQELCEAGGLAAQLDPSSIVGVVPHGVGSSETVASLLASRNVTIVSPTSSNNQLTGSPYFLSTIPPDKKQADALAQVALQMGWKYMSAVNSESEFGTKGMEDFFASAYQGGNREVICMGARYSLKEGATIDDAREIIKQLNGKQGASGVVLYTSTAHTRLLLQAVQEMGLQDSFVFIRGTNADNSLDVPEALRSTLDGSISFQVRSSIIQDFLDYVMSLTVYRHGDIPDDWFADFWQMALKCKLENSTRAQDQHPRVCGPSDRLTAANIRQDDYVLQTIIATYITALGLVNADNCQDSPLGIAGCLREKGEMRRQVIYEGIKGSSWDLGEIKEDFTFRFTPQGYGNTGLAVMVHQKIPGTDQYEYKQIGLWTDDGLNLNVGDYTRQRSRSDPRPVGSSCPPGDVCKCVAYNGTVIGAGGSGTISPTFSPVVGTNVDLNGKLATTWGIIVAALTALGILVTLCAFVYLLIFYPIKGGTSVLGFILLVAVLAMYVLVFAFLLNDVPETCAIRRFCLGLVYALAFSCILVKVLNTWRLGAYFSEYLPSYQRLAHPCSLVFIVISLTLVQVIIGTEWLILRPPSVDSYTTSDGRIIPRCSPADFHNEELVLSCIYVMVLMLLSLIFSAVTWDSEENHRESRWMLITTCFTIGIMIVWTIVSTLADIQYREPAIAIALLINATIILLAIFVRKIYLLNKYQKEADEERRSHFGVHDASKDHEFYSTLYNNQAFDQSGEVSSRKGAASHNGSGIVYVYDGTTGVGQNNVY